jgi:hypothetical protein
MLCPHVAMVIPTGGLCTLLANLVDPQGVRCRTYHAVCAGCVVYPDPVRAVVCVEVFATEFVVTAGCVGGLQRGRGMHSVG